MDTPRPLPQHPDLMENDALSAWVQTVVDGQEEEGVLLDYKATTYDLRKTEDKAELAKDISSFANAEGGVILQGVPEKKGPQGRSIPDPNYGIPREQDYEARASRVLASVVSPMLPQLRIRWVPSLSDTGKGVYVIWHPQSWLAPHMVHGYREFKYFWRDADSSRPVPMTEQQVDRLYQRRAAGEQRREAFFSQIESSLGYPPSSVPQMAVCLCPRLFADAALDIASHEFREHILGNLYAVGRETAEWRPTSSGTYSMHQIEDLDPRVAQLHSNGALSVSVPLVRKGDAPETVYFRRIVLELYSAYDYVGRVYSRLGRQYLELDARVWLDGIARFRLHYDPAGPTRHMPLYDGPHVLRDRLFVANIVADIHKAVKPMLNQVWQTFGVGFDVPADIVQAKLADTEWARRE